MEGSSFVLLYLTTLTYITIQVIHPTVTEQHYHLESWPNGKCGSDITALLALFLVSTNSLEKYNAMRVMRMKLIEAVGKLIFW